jgi:hypothetical protein
MYNYEVKQQQRINSAISCHNWFLFCSLEAQLWGFNYQLNSVERLPLMKAHKHLGTSWRVYSHLNQIGWKKQFVRYEFDDPKLNKNMYGPKMIPPIYDLSKIKTPIALIYGSLDNPKDVLWLRDEVASGLTTVVYAKSHNLDRNGFVLAREMKWFETIDELLTIYPSGATPRPSK